MNNRFKSFILLFCLLMLVILPNPGLAADENKVTSLAITLDKEYTDENVLQQNEKIVMNNVNHVSMILTATYADGTQQKQTYFADWKTDNPNIAIIGAGGNPPKRKVIPMTVGSTVVTASYGGVTISVKVEITKATVMINGVVQVYDQPPVILNDRTLVPLRGIFEALGANVSWDQNAKTVLATKEGTTVCLTIGSNKAYKNGEVINLDQPPQLINDRTMVPVRFVSEALGAKVDWDDRVRTVIITSPVENVIRIGLIAPLSGEVKDFGESVKNAFNIALEEKRYRVGNYKIEAVISDDRNDATEAINVATKLITQDKVSAIVGSLTSKTTIPLSRLANDNKVVLITETATNEKVTVDVGKRKEFVFRACFVDPMQGTVAAKFALQTLKKKTAAVLYDQGNSYTEGLARNFKEAFEKGGGRVMTFETYTHKDTDFSPLLTRIAQQKPDILYLPDYYMKASLIGKQAREMGIRSVFLGGDGWDSLDIDWQTMEGSYFTTQWSPDDPRPEVKEWVDKYKAKYGTTPDVIATLAYDATQILLRAIEESDSSDPAKIREAMQNTKDFPAVTGTISINQDGNPIKPVVVMQIKDGRQVYVTTVMP